MKESDSEYGDHKCSDSAIHLAKKQRSKGVSKGQTSTRDQRKTKRAAIQEQSSEQFTATIRMLRNQLDFEKEKTKRACNRAIFYKKKSRIQKRQLTISGEQLADKNAVLVVKQRQIDNSDDQFKRQQDQHDQ